MSPLLRKLVSPKSFLCCTLGFCLLLTVLLLYLLLGHAENDFDSFTEPVLTLDAGWTLTDGDGASQEIVLPLIISYGADGCYTLSTLLPEDAGLISSPALCFYSNYVDLAVELDGQLLYAYPAAAAAFSGATGNTYHFVRLPVDYAGRRLSIRVRGQLGDDITYLLKAPLLGSKATVLRQVVVSSMPAILLAGCMLVLGLVLAVLHLSLRRSLQLNSATAYTAVFALLFALYVFCETSFAQMLLPNGYALCCCTLLLLALLPIPLMGLFSELVAERFRTVPVVLMLLCSLNLALQTVLNFTGLLSVRVLLPGTHVSIILSISVMALCLLCSGRAARRKLLSALPMIAGGLTDIILLALERPSHNNSLWFTLGVTSFLIIQFCGFVRGFFDMYRVSLESRLLHDMAYRDALTDIGNRNAYERRLKELSAAPPSTALCCLVLDINDLKLINDRLGHQSGDIAIVETGRLLRRLAPEAADCFRTGGDEFVLLAEPMSETEGGRLAVRLTVEADRRGRECDIPLSLAVGCGNYQPDDGSVIDFIRRVDSLMYSHKRSLKCSPDYPFAEEADD